MNAMAIETVGLSKFYGDVKAVRNLSLTVKPGEIYAFLGLNGAGKTTTIRMLLGMVKPTGGYARILGQQISYKAHELWSEVGYLVETPHAYPELTVKQNVETIRKLRPGVPKQAVVDVIDRLGLAPYANRRAGTLSLGNAQRLGLAKALLHQPSILILDEPSNGLDPAGIVEIRKLLMNLAHQQGVTVFISSHLLGEVARMADRVGIIHHGALLVELDAAELHGKRHRSIIIHTDHPAETLALLHAANLVSTQRRDGVITVADPLVLSAPQTLNAQLVHAGYAPQQFYIQEENLEAYFLRLVEQSGEHG